MPDKYIKMLQAMLTGSLTSLEVFFLTILFSIPLALPIAMGRMSKHKLLSGVTNVFLLIIRGTPLMLQLLVVYFGPGLFVRWLVLQGYDVSFRWNRFVAAIVALFQCESNTFSAAKAGKESFYILHGDEARRKLFASHLFEKAGFEAKYSW